MKKTLLLLALFSFFYHLSLAQCPPFPAEIGCGSAIPTNSGIDGYCNTLVPQTQITEPLPDCGGTAVMNNDDWLAFYAGTSTITLLITPSNCQGSGGNMGIQAGLYSACQIDGGVNGDGLASGSLVVQCGCTTGPINMSYSNFVVGQIYYLVIDGCGGDLCDYEIDVLEGNTGCLDITQQTGDIEGNTELCSGEIAFFNTEPVEFATNYNWSVDSNASITNGQGTTLVEVLIETEGQIEICVTPTNGCSEGTVSCIIINSMGIVQTTTFVESFCEGDSIEFEGIYYHQTGFYSSIYTGVDGCDSILNLDLTVDEIYEIFIDTTLCEATSFEVGDSVYTENGSYENLFTSTVGCDSSVYLDLTFGSNSQTTLELYVCENETIIIWGNEITPPATIVNHLQSAEGCDSLVSITINAIPVPLTNIDTLLEPGGIYKGVVYENDTTIIDYHTAANGCDSIVTTNIMVETDAVSLPEGIDQLNIFPNPANNQFIVQLDLNDALELRLDIYNTLRKKINNAALASQFQKGNHNIEIDASQLAIGTYFLHFQTEKGNVSKRLVIAR